MISNETGHTELTMSTDIGEYSDCERESYKNSWVLLSSEFRYFGKDVHQSTDAHGDFRNIAKRKLG